MPQAHPPIQHLQLPITDHSEYIAQVVAQLKALAAARESDPTAIRRSGLAEAVNRGFVKERAVGIKAWAVEGNDSQAICLFQDTQSGGAVEGVFLGGRYLVKREGRGLDLRKGS
jgi:hypothetical protein